MNKEIKIPLEKLISYLKDDKWKIKDSGIKGLYFINKNNHEFFIPKNENLEDYNFRMNLFLDNLSNIKEKRKETIMEEILYKNHKNIKARISSEKTIYKLTIQDGENEYDLFRENCPKLEGCYIDICEEIVDNFTRVIKRVEKLKVTEEELNTLKRLGVV